MARVFKRSYVDRKTGQPRKTRKYYGWHTNAEGIRSRVSLCEDKVASEQKLNDLRRRSEREREGLIDRFHEHQKRPLIEHVRDFRRHLEAKNNTPGHIATTLARVQAIVNGCGFRFIRDISPSAVENWLKEQRDTDAFGISTSNHYLRAVKSFTTWLVKTRRTSENALAGLSALNADADIRRERRDCSADEFRRLLQAAVKGPQVCGLNGPERAALYLTATYTGLRASELASLTPGSFDFGADPPTVTVQAAYSKHRRKDVLPLHPDLAGRLQAWLRMRETSQDDQEHVLPIHRETEPKLWPGQWASRRHAAEMLRHDLQTARKTWIKEAVTGPERTRREQSGTLKYVDDSGRVLDFHALRHTFITNLAKGGVHPKIAQELARHSTITLTMDRYSHVGLIDMDAGLRALPDLTHDSKAAAATGTDDLTGPQLASKLAPTGPKLARAADGGCSPMRAIENQNHRNADSKKSLEKQAFESDCDSVRFNEGKCRRGDSNPHSRCQELDFESSASANSATPAGDCRLLLRSPFRNVSAECGT